MSSSDQGFADSISSLVEEAPPFKEFLDSIPERKHELLLSCGLTGGVASESFDRYKRFIPDHHQVIYGLVGETDQYYALMFGSIGDDVYPTLFTYDEEGNILDQLSLILNPCGGADEHSIPHSYAQIDTNLKITLLDTLRHIHYPDERGDYVLDSITTTVVTYRISAEGRFERN
jgi:hypothetical protein